MAAHIRLSLAVLDNLVASGYTVQFLWDRALEKVPTGAAPVLERLEVHGVAQAVQQGDILGERMSQALDAGLRGFGKAMIVGSDCPSVDADYVRTAGGSARRGGRGTGTVGGRRLCSHRCSPGYPGYACRRGLGNGKGVVANL